MYICVSTTNRTSKCAIQFAISNFQADIISRARVVVVEVVATVEGRGMTTHHKETEETPTHPEASKTGNFLIFKFHIGANKPNFQISVQKINVCSLTFDLSDLCINQTEQKKYFICSI